MKKIILGFGFSVVIFLSSYGALNISLADISSFSFNKNLKFGMVDPQVQLLQRYLNNNSFPVALTGPGSKGQETIYFGNLTKAALIKFQENNDTEILSPQQLKNGTGNFYVFTRNFVNSNIQKDNTEASTTNTSGTIFSMTSTSTNNITSTTFNTPNASSTVIAFSSVLPSTTTVTEVSIASNSTNIISQVTTSDVHRHRGGSLLTSISTSPISGVTVPVFGQTPTATIADTSEYTATISWNGNPTRFAVNTAYTAVITITPKSGHTLSGVAENFFTVAGATTTNNVNSGIVTAVFPETSPIQLTISTPTLTISKTYDGTTTAAVTAGSLSGVVDGDTVTASAIATYDTISVGTGKTITVVYTLSGASSASYITPTNYSTTTGVIIATVPGAPIIGTATAGNATSTVTFTAPANNGGSAIIYYTVTSSSTGAVITASSSTSPITITGLTNDTAYTFTVTATNAVGTSTASDISNSVTPIAPYQPYVIDTDDISKLYVYPTDNSTNIAWGCYGTTIGAGAQSYTDGSGNTTAIVNGCSDASSTVAAKLCADLNSDPVHNLGYTGWYLPAIDQLNAMNNQRNNATLTGGAGWVGFVSSVYWSSTEYSGYSTDLTWTLGLFNGTSNSYFYKTDGLHVRCVR